MKIKYEFADGTVSEVEVEEAIGAVIIEDRRLEDNLSRKERYHCSYHFFYDRNQRYHPFNSGAAGEKHRRTA